MIHTLTLNPAIDKLLFLDKFKKNITNRLRSNDDSLGGKGTHVSVNLKSLGIDNTAFGISYGQTGRKIIHMLSKSGVNVQFIHRDESDSRINYILIEDNGDCSTFASGGIYLDKETIDELINRMLPELKENDSLILSGDTSNCFDPCVYNYIINKLKPLSLRIYFDASGPTLRECLNEFPFLIKPNLDELSQLCDRELRTDSEIIDAISSLDRYHIYIVAVSLGENGSIVKCSDSLYRAIPPKVKVLNTIGCGDCYLSGMIYGIEKKYDMEQTLRFATAISAATAESESSVGFNLQRAQELMPMVTIKKI